MALGEEFLQQNKHSHAAATAAAASVAAAAGSFVVVAADAVSVVDLYNAALFLKLLLLQTTGTYERV